MIGLLYKKKAKKESEKSIFKISLSLWLSGMDYGMMSGSEHNFQR